MSGGTLVLGDNCLGGQMPWGDRCPGGTLVQGDKCRGDNCPGGHLFRGTNVGGTVVGGTNVTPPFASSFLMNFSDSSKFFAICASEGPPSVPKTHTKSWTQIIGTKYFR